MSCDDLGTPHACPLPAAHDGSPETRQSCHRPSVTGTDRTDMQVLDVGSGSGYLTALVAYTIRNYHTSMYVRVTIVTDKE